MVMAFSSYHLWQDWRRPSQALARLFTDFEPGVHFPQVQMQSGVTGVNIARIYNPIKQSRDQDPEGAFIRRWVPEIGPLPDEFVHEPWTAPPALLAAKGIVLGETYALRLVDHETAARQARQSVYAVRAGEAFFEKARDIQRRHGSRKSGLPSIERPARPKPKAKPAQTEFDF
jgi:deoxyribodipyrimidine photo-lyase